MENENKIISLLVLFLIVSLGFVSCKTNEDERSFEKEMEFLAEYIEINNITVNPTASGLYYIELTEGTGELPKTGDTVSVKYTGRLVDGSVFGSSTYDFVIGTDSVIKAWDEGIIFMKKGGTAVIIAPSTLAYGAVGYGSIPPYTTLIFSVELLDIK